MRFLFAHISWMPRYLGQANEPIFSTHGWVLENNDAHEKWNFKPVGKRLFGYVPIRGKKNEDAPGEIKIGRLGSGKGDDFVDDITVIWFANNPDDPKRAYVVGWYRNARVFRSSQRHQHRGYRFSCAVRDATLLEPKIRNFLVPHINSVDGQKLGYGYGQSSLWYADKNADVFLKNIHRYINQIDDIAERIDSNFIEEVKDAIDDLDERDMGDKCPDRNQHKVFYFVRNNAVRSLVISRAKGRCEFCSELGFLKDDGSRFIEAHHIIHLAKQGPDTLENVIGLCPNHHRQAHFGKDREQLEANLKKRLLQLKGK